MAGINPVTDVMGVSPMSMIIKIVVVGIAVIVAMVIMLVIKGVPVIMVSVVVVPVVWTPWIPVDRVITPVPGRVPCYITREIYEPYQRPGCNFIVSGSYHGHILPV
jgi:hypothetical protein